MSIINVPTEKSVEGVVGTSSGNQRVVMTSVFSGTQLTHSTDSVEIMCEDGSGNKQRCVAVTHFEDSESSPIPSQVGNAGKFLKTNGTTLEWDDALQNKATGSLGVAIEGDATGDGSIAVGKGSESSGQSGISIGTGAESSGDDSICIGGIANDGGEDYNTIVGGRASASEKSNTVLGYNSSSSALGSIAIGYQAEATENGTMVVGLAVDGVTPVNYTLLDPNGKIPAARFDSLPSSNGNYRLRLTINNGVATYSWVAE